MVEQRYQAVLAVIAEGHSVVDVASRWRVSRQTVHGWLRRYEDAGLNGLNGRSRRAVSSLCQMPAEVEATVLDQLGGALRRRWRPDGLICEIEVPVGRALVTTVTPASPPP